MPFCTSISTQMKTYKQQQSRSTSSSGNSLKTRPMDVWGSATEVNLRRWLRDALLWKGQPGLIAIPTPELWGLIESVSFLTDFFESIKVKEVCGCVHVCDSECVDVCGLCLWTNAELLPFSSGPYISHFFVLCAMQSSAKRTKTLMQTVHEYISSLSMSWSVSVGGCTSTATHSASFQQFICCHFTPYQPRFLHCFHEWHSHGRWPTYALSPLDTVRGI